MNQRRQNIEDLEQLADLLDTKFKGPFGLRFGWDGILGLIPGLGDLITNLMAAFIILRATTMGYPGSVVARMFLNFCFDNFLDAIPFIGNIFDFFFKANIRNMQLMREYELDPARAQRRSAIWVALVLFMLVAIVGGMIVGSIYLTVLAFNWITGLLASS